MAESKIKTISWEDGQNRITFAPHHGRLLQVEIEGHNAIWENDNYQGDWNPGGDRLWIAPENDFFWKIKGPFDFEHYQIPPSLSENDWNIQEETHSLTLSKELNLENLHTKKTFKAKASRHYSKTEAHQDMDWLAVSAFTTKDTLVIEQNPAIHQKIGIWSLLQLPAGGTLSIPIQEENDHYQNYFNPIPEDLWNIENKQLKLKITGAHHYKVGVAKLSEGKLFYTREIDQNRKLVIIRSFDLCPKENYCDKPLITDRELGDIAQVYNDGGEHGGFGELEIHSGSIDFASGSNTCEFITKTSIGIIR